jgi:hypothetical protein
LLKKLKNKHVSNHNLEWLKDLQGFNFIYIF